MIKRILYKVLGVKLTRILFISRHYMDIMEFGDRINDLQKDEGYFDDHMWAAKLRRLAHMIDKGIQIDGYEIGRSLRYYDEAQNLLGRIKSADVLKDPSVIWAKKKLREYEVKQKGPPQKLNHPVPKTNCSYENLLNAIMTRRSCRNFSRKPVPDDILKKVIKVIDWAPTSCNRQTAQVFATNNPELVRECMANCSGATCFSDYVPVFFSFCSDARAYSIPKELVMPYIDISLGIQNCNLTAHSLGLSLTLLTWTGRTEQEEKNLRQLLRIPKYCEIVVNGVAGYPQAGVDVPLRKSLDHTLYIITKNSCVL